MSKILANLQSDSKSRKRRGRGTGSGTGRHSGRGHKGQRARSGRTRPGFEGGQNPLIKRIPKTRGFKSFKTKIRVINLRDVAKKFKDGETVDSVSLFSKGFISSRVEPYKILGDGDFSKKLKITAPAFSKSALKKIKDAGGEATTEGPKGSNPRPSSGQEGLKGPKGSAK